MKNEDRSNQVERLLSTQRAARVVSDSAIFWWQQVADAADSAMTDDSLDGFYRLLLEAVQPVLEADEVSILIADGTQSSARCSDVPSGLAKRPKSIFGFRLAKAWPDRCFPPSSLSSFGTSRPSRSSQQPSRIKG